MNDLCISIWNLTEVLAKTAKYGVVMFILHETGIEPDHISN